MRTTRYAKTADGVHIAYQVFGDGPHDLVIHPPWLFNVDACWDFPEMAASLESFGRYARVILFDRRGFGVSDRPTSPDVMAVEKGMDDVRAVMDAVGSDEAVLVERAGREPRSRPPFAATYPERTSGLIALGEPLVGEVVARPPTTRGPHRMTEVGARVPAKTSTMGGEPAPISIGSWHWEQVPLLIRADDDRAFRRMVHHALCGAVLSPGAGHGVQPQLREAERLGFVSPSCYTSPTLVILFSYFLRKRIRGLCSRSSLDTSPDAKLTSNSRRCCGEFTLGSTTRPRRNDGGHRQRLRVEPPPSR